MNKRELFPYSNRGSQLYVVDAEEKKELNKIFFSLLLSPSFDCRKTARKEWEKKRKCFMACNFSKSWMSVNCDTIRNVIDTAFTAQQGSECNKTLFMDYPNYCVIQQHHICTSLIYSSSIKHTCMCGCILTDANFARQNVNSHSSSTHPSCIQPQIFALEISILNCVFWWNDEWIKCISNVYK